MRKFYKITPEGTRDLLFEECSELIRQQTKLNALFTRYGYRPVKTPDLEFYDVFSVDASGIAQEEMFKLTDTSGRLMVLRPDNTFPIARLVSTSFQNEKRPLRISYSQSVHSVGNSLRGKSCQNYQSGIELIGVSGKRADLEVITLALETMNSYQADYRFEIGHAQFFKALIAELPIGEDMREDIRRIIELKNYAELSEKLDALEQTQAVVALKRLPRLFGGIEILDEAAQLCNGLSCVSCLEYLREIYNDLVALGYSDRVIIDLGLVHRNEYYTGVIFGCYINGTGDSVLSGGRYDNLLEQFGAHDAAIGFAVNVSAMTLFVLKESLLCGTRVDVLVAAIGGGNADVEAVRTVRKMTSLYPDKVITSESFENKKQAQDYALECSIAEIIFVLEGAENV